MAVAHSASSTASSKATGATSINHTNMTVGASDTALIGMLALDWFGHSAPTGVSLIWDNGGTSQAMTKVISANDNGGVTDVYLFALRSPTSGNKTAHAAWTGTVAGAELFFFSVTGSETSSDAAAFKNTNSITGAKTNNLTENTAALAITSATGDMAVAAWATDCNINSVSQTQEFASDNTTTDSGFARATGAASVSFTASLAGNNGSPYVGIGFDIAAAAGGTTKTISGVSNWNNWNLNATVGAGRDLSATDTLQNWSMSAAAQAGRSLSAADTWADFTSSISSQSGRDIGSALLLPDFISSISAQAGRDLSSNILIPDFTSLMSFQTGRSISGNMIWSNFNISATLTDSAQVPTGGLLPIWRRRRR